MKAHKTKHKGKQRILYLTTDAMKILNEQREKHLTGHLFRTRGDRPFTGRALVGRMAALQRKLGARVTCYGYRHALATRLLSRGVPDTHVAAILGHSNTRMIHAHYSHLAADAKLLREAAEKAG